MDLSVLAALYFTILQVVSVLHSVSGSAIQITSANFESYRNGKDIVFLNFYADWCRFSQMLKPVFEKAAATLHSELPEKVLLGKIDCDKEKDLCNSPFHVTKYPTLKVVRHGQVARREFRGQRSADAIVSYVKEQLVDPVKTVEHLHEITGKAVVGFFDTNASMEYDVFRKAAVNLRDDCPFYAILGQQQGAPQVTFRDEGVPDAVYPGNMLTFRPLLNWIHDFCIPLVREITFKNGEEMTEEGLPLLILFYNPDEPEVKEEFKERVMSELAEFKGTINTVTANGVTFAHPLHHLGKRRQDLPVLAIDSFKHMFVFPRFEDMRVPGKLKQFVADLHSGKLHREYHYGPDPTEQLAQTPGQQQQADGTREKRSGPVESTFKKLKPADSRYSFRFNYGHDEL